MIKNIVNWTLGGFFRTLGKFLLFLVISLVLGYFIAKNDIKLPLKLIGIQKVDALTTITPQSYSHKVYYDCFHPSNGYVSSSETDWFTGDKTISCSSGLMTYQNKDYLQVKLSSSLNPGQTYTMNFSTWVTTRNPLSYYNNNAYYFVASNTGSYTGVSQASITAFNCKVGIAEGTTGRLDYSCTFTPSQQINYLYLRITFDSDYIETTSSLGNTRPSLLYDNAQIDAINQQTSIIQHQTTEINNNINELNDNLMDDNVDDTNNSFANFVNNFDPPLDGLISDLVTLPLNLLTTLIDGSSTADLCTTWRNKQICLPNGQLVWGRNNASVNAFKLFFMLAVGGSIAYKCIRGLVKTMEITLDPTQNGVEVMKL